MQHPSDLGAEMQIINPLGRGTTPSYRRSRVWKSLQAGRARGAHVRPRREGPSLSLLQFPGDEDRRGGDNQNDNADRIEVPGIGAREGASE
jgi:hypothetical protein